MHLARSGREEHVGTKTASEQLEPLHTSDETMDGFGRIVWCVHNTSLNCAAPEHIRPATERETFLHEVSAVNLLPSRFEQVLQDGRVPDGAWTDLLDQSAPPAEAVEARMKTSWTREAPRVMETDSATANIETTARTLAFGRKRC